MFLLFANLDHLFVERAYLSVVILSRRVFPSMTCTKMDFMLYSLSILYTHMDVLCVCSNVISGIIHSI